MARAKILAKPSLFIYSQQVVQNQQYESDLKFSPTSEAEIKEEREGCSREAWLKLLESKLRHASKNVTPTIDNESDRKHSP